ncbi:tetratricopeptide repeat protein [Megalodesulfovibrio paquesii]
MQQAAAMVADGNRQGALVVYKSLLKDHPENQEALAKVVLVQIELGKLTQAAADLEQLKDEHPDKPSLQAKLLLGQKKTKEAEDLLLKAVEQQKQNSELWELLGVARGTQGRLEEALADFRHALELSPNNELAGIGEVSALIAMQRGDEARAALQQLLQQHPESKQGLHQLALFQLQDGQTQAAIETYAKLGALRKSDVAARYQEARLRLQSNGDAAQARATADALGKEFVNIPEPFKLNGLADLHDGNYAAAITALQRALTIRRELDTHFYLGLAFQKQGTLEQALSHFHTVLGATPDNQFVRQRVAAIYLQQGRVDEALGESDRLLSHNPDSMAGKLLQGEAFLARKEFDKSLEVFTELSSAHAADPRLQIKRGLLLAGKGELAEAEACFRLAIAAAPSDLEPRVVLMTLLLRQDRLDDAATLLDDPTLEGRNAAMAKNALAKIRLRQGREADAETLLQEARQLAPELPLSSINLAAMRMRKGQVAEACAELETGLAQAPKDLDLIMRAASCAQSQGHLEVVQGHLARAMELGAPQGFAAAAALHARQGDFNASVALLDTFLATHPDNKPLLAQKAQLLTAAKNKEKALDTLQRLEALDQEGGVMERIRLLMAFNEPQAAEREAERLISFAPNSARHYFPLVLVKESQKDPAGAEAILQRALAAEPDNPDALMSLGKLLHTQGRSEEALQAFDRVISTQPEPVPALAAKGAVLQALGREKEAVEMYEQALQLRNNYGLVLNNLAMIYADHQDTLAKAEQLAISAYKAEGNNPAVLDTLAYILILKGKQDEARQLLSKALELYPNDATLKARMQSVASVTAPAPVQ